MKAASIVIRENGTSLVRRIVPIEVTITSGHVTFEKKLPFTAAKVVGLLGMVSLKEKPMFPQEPTIIQ